MSSGVTLVAAGRDNPLNIDPDFTFFSTVFKRHTNFSSVIDRLNINTKPSNNGSSTSRFEIKGDLLSYVYLVCESPENFTVKRDWSQVIDKVELFIGNQLIDTQYYEYSKKIAPDVQASSLSRSVKGPDGSTSSYFYPFKFFFCEDWASTIPLIALNYHDVEVVIHWSDDVYGQLEVQAYLNLLASYWNTYFEDIRNAVSTYQDVTINATDGYTEIQANVLIYHNEISNLPETDQYTDYTSEISAYQTFSPEILLILRENIINYQNVSVQNNQERITYAENIIFFWDEADVLYNYSNTAPTNNNVTGYLTYDGFTDNSSNYDASNSLSRFINSNIASEILKETNNIINGYTTLVPTPPLSVPTSNATSGYLIWIDKEDTEVNKEASSNLKSYIQTFHYADVISSSSNIINQYNQLGISNVLLKNETSGFLRFDNNNQDSTSAYPSSNALYEYMTVKHFEPRTIYAQQIVNAWDTANAIYSFSNAAPSFGSNGFILYDAIQDDGTQYDGSNSLVTFSNFEENVVRIANATALVNGYINIVTGINNPKAAPTYDENTGFITFDGATDVAGSNVGSTALYTYMENYGQTILGYSFDLFTRYIYIDKDERRITADRSVDYVITQTQRIPASNKKEIELPLSHPVSFIASTASNFNDTNNMLLEINGEPIGEAKQTVPHYRHVSTYFHSPYGSNQNTTMIYPFCLDASKRDPTGSLNFSRLDSARIILDEAINGDIYAVNYNILRISNGVGGLLYA